MDEQQKQKLKAAGFSDQDIADYEQEHGKGLTEKQATSSGPTQVDETVPSYVGEDYHNRSALEYPAMAAGALHQLPNPKEIVGDYVVPAAELYGLYKAPSILQALGGKPGQIAGEVAKGVGGKVDTALDLFKQHLDQSAAREARISNRPGFGGAPSNSPAPTYNAPTGVPNTRPMPMPTNMGTSAGIPAAAPAPAAQPSMVQRGMNYAQEMQRIAAQRVMPALSTAANGVANLARGSVAPGFALYHGGLNTNEEQELARRRGMGPTIR